MEHFTQAGNRLIWTGDGETLVVEPWGADSLRVRSSLTDILDWDWALLPPAPTDAVITVDGDVARLSNGRITATLRAESHDDGAIGYRTFSCAVEFTDADGALLLRELDRGGSLKLTARHYTPIPGGDHALTVSFDADPDEKLCGMGQYQQAVIDIKGSTFELAHRNSQASIPFVMSSRGYGFLWHNPAVGRATFGRNRTEWHATSTRQLDYWITAGENPAAIARNYADATGHAPTMPEYGLGYWQCKLRYWNQEQLLDVAREHARRGIPLDVIVADFFHWPKMGDYRFDEEFWPDPAAMTAELAELGVQLMVSVWPQVSIDSENYARLRKDNHLVRAAAGNDIHMSFQGPSMFVDVTHPGARERLWELCKANYWDQGVRAFWLDEAEPEYGRYDYGHYRYHAGPVLQVGNIYPQLFARTFYEGMRAAGQDEIVNLVRCAWAGSQRYGALMWSGDITSTFTDLRRQIVAGIHMGVAGIPWFTTDIGGFYHGDITDPAFHELLVRWFQFGVFSPVMRMHGDRNPHEPVFAADGSPRLHSGADNEIWSFGEELTELLTAYVRLREALRPYTRRLMEQAHTDGQPVMRGLFHEFPADPAAWDIADQYLYGPDLLIAPVVEAGRTERDVYLPAGASWTDLHTGQVHNGGRTITAAAPLAQVPVFGRDGAGMRLSEHLPH